MVGLAAEYYNRTHPCRFGKKPLATHVEALQFCLLHFKICDLISGFPHPNDPNECRVGTGCDHLDGIDVLTDLDLPPRLDDSFRKTTLYNITALWEKTKVDSSCQ